MKFGIIYIFVYLLCQFNILGQNSSYRSINEQVYPLLKAGDYEKAKVSFKNIEQNSNVDPGQKLLFLMYSLKFGDVRYFKNQITNLIKFHGWHYNDLDAQKSNEFNDLLVEHHLQNWLIEKSSLLYPKWITENFNSFQIQQKLQMLVESDQTRGHYYRLQSNVLFSDSIRYDAIESTIGNLDFNNIVEIFKLCLKVGLPNNFQHGCGTSSDVQLLLLHALGNVENFDRAWQLLFPYIHEAYFQGYISSGLFVLYDNMCLKHKGYQYFGTVSDGTIIDSLGVAERKKKYNL